MWCFVASWMESTPIELPTEPCDATNLVIPNPLGQTPSPLCLALLCCSCSLSQQRKKRLDRAIYGTSYGRYQRAGGSPPRKATGGASDGAPLTLDDLRRSLVMGGSGAGGGLVVPPGFVRKVGADRPTSGGSLSLATFEYVRSDDPHVPNAPMGPARPATGAVASHFPLSTSTIGSLPGQSSAAGVDRDGGPRVAPVATARLAAEQKVLAAPPRVFTYRRVDWNADSGGGGGRRTNAGGAAVRPWSVSSNGVCDGPAKMSARHQGGPVEAEHSGSRRESSSRSRGRIDGHHKDRPSVAALLARLDDGTPLSSSERHHFRRALDDLGLATTAAETSDGGDSDGGDRKGRDRHVTPKQGHLGHRARSPSADSLALPQGRRSSGGDLARGWSQDLPRVHRHHHRNRHGGDGGGRRGHQRSASDVPGAATSETLTETRFNDLTFDDEEGAVSVESATPSERMYQTVDAIVGDTATAADVDDSGGRPTTPGALAGALGAVESLDDTASRERGIAGAMGAMLGLGAAVGFSPTHSTADLTATDASSDRFAGSPASHSDDEASGQGQANPITPDGDRVSPDASERSSQVGHRLDRREKTTGGFRLTPDTSHEALSRRRPARSRSPTRSQSRPSSGDGSGGGGAAASLPPTTGSRSASQSGDKSEAGAAPRQPLSGSDHGDGDGEGTHESEDGSEAANAASTDNEGNEASPEAPVSPDGAPLRTVAEMQVRPGRRPLSGRFTDLAKRLRDKLDFSRGRISVGDGDGGGGDDDAGGGKDAAAVAVDGAGGTAIDSDPAGAPLVILVEGSSGSENVLKYPSQSRSSSPSGDSRGSRPRRRPASNSATPRSSGSVSPSSRSSGSTSGGERGYDESTTSSHSSAGSSRTSRESRRKRARGSHSRGERGIPWGVFVGFSFFYFFIFFFLRWSPPSFVFT